MRLTMQPTRPSLADAMRILDRLHEPVEAKFDAGSAHRMVLAMKPERGLVSIVGPNGLFYANAVGAFGAGSAGRNWDSLASAVHRWALKLVDNNEFSLLFSDGALVLAESEIFEDPFFLVIFPNESRIPL